MSILRESFKQTVKRWILVILRVQLGLVFIVAGWPKISDLGNWPARMRGAVENAFLPQSHDFYRGILESLILPNIELFAYIVAIGEIVIGIALLIGLATRVFSALAVFFLLNYMSMKGALFWTPSSNDAALMMNGLVVFLGNAGKVLGVDLFLGKKKTSPEQPSSEE